MTNKRHDWESDSSEKKVPARVLDAAVQNAASHDRFAVICTDGDIEYTRTREEAKQVA